MPCRVCNGTKVQRVTTATGYTLDIPCELCKTLDPATIEARMARHGFYLQETGGGCTAYVRLDNPRRPEVEEIVTVAHGPHAPEALTDAVVVSSGWEDNDDRAVTQGYTLADVLAALDNPSDEYALLDLRLHNGFHKR